MSQSMNAFVRVAVSITVGLVEGAVLYSTNAQAQSTMTITTYAGDGAAAFSGDGGPAASAALNLPKGMTVDASGSLYIADSQNFRVRRVTNGVITTVAGNGINAFSGDGGPAINASFSDIQAVAVDAQGNLYIADSDNRRVRKVTPAGIVTTIAGIGIEGYSGDGGPATAAMIGRPEGLAIDAAGNLYIADSTRQRVRKIDTSGIITTVAGNGVEGFSGDAGPAVNASLDFPIGVAVDRAGNIYVADGNNNRIRKITPGGIISTLAGTGVAAAADASGDGGPAIFGSLNIPSDVAADASGNVYIADSGHNEVRMVNPAGTISTVAGTGENGYSGDGGPATQAMLNYPWGLAADPLGNVYVADRVNTRIRLLASGVALGQPVLQPDPVVNGASFAQNAAIAPGSIVTIFGSNLSAGAVIAQGAPYPSVLGTTSVTFNGTQAPLFYVSSNQINAQAPYNLPLGTVSVQVSRGSAVSAVQSAAVMNYSPGIFIIDQPTQGGAILHATTFGIVSAASPAKPGEIIAIYGTGLGALTIPITAGNPAPSTGTLPQTLTMPTVTIAGLFAPVGFSGLAPGFAGLYQVNVQVPAGAPSGTQQLEISIGGFTSNVATIAVSQ